MLIGLCTVLCLMLVSIKINLALNAYWSWGAPGGTAQGVTVAAAVVGADADPVPHGTSMQLPQTAVPPDGHFL